MKAKLDSSNKHTGVVMHGGYNGQPPRQPAQGIKNVARPAAPPAPPPPKKK